MGLSLFSLTDHDELIDRSFSAVVRNLDPFGNPMSLCAYGHLMMFVIVPEV